MPFRKLVLEVEDYLHCLQLPSFYYNEFYLNVLNGSYYRKKLRNHRLARSPVIPELQVITRSHYIAYGLRHHLINLLIAEQRSLIFGHGEIGCLYPKCCRRSSKQHQWAVCIGFKWSVAPSTSNAPSPGPRSRADCSPAHRKLNGRTYF